jgi:alpha-maltose-1-phosphate synthase
VGTLGTESKANAAFFYEVDGYSTAGSRVLGRQSAGESFLKGFLNFGDVSPLYCYADHPGKYKSFQTQVDKMAGKPVPTEWISPLSSSSMTNPGCLFYSGPGLENFAWQRNHIDPRSYSLCGLTHTISSIAVMDHFAQYAVAPFEEWDAVICTSQSVRSTVDYVMQNWCEYLERRNGGKVKIPLQLPIIPLGINCADFEPPKGSAGYVKKFKKQYNIKKNDIVVLFVGRLAAHAKAHPLPMYQALEKAAQETGKKIHLIQAGWFASDSIETQFVNSAKKFCPSINAIFLDGRELETRINIWHVADIFCTLSDNIQETFGITPIEAMAAGLPVVATDWDGYRETMKDGVDSLLVKTQMPHPGCGPDLAYRYEMGIDSYDRYVGQVSLFTNVDTDHCASLFVKLIEDPQLRKKMGENGKKRAKEIFDWSVLVPTYQNLWAELADRRKAAAEKPRLKVSSPLRDDPFSMFAHYPTELINVNTVLQLKPGNRSKASHYLSDPMGSGVAPIMPKPEFLDHLLDGLEKDGPMSVKQVCETHKLRIPIGIRISGWLAKMNFIELLNK